MNSVERHLLWERFVFMNRIIQTDWICNTGFCVHLMAPVDPFFNRDCSNQQTSNDSRRFQQLRRCCLCPGPCSHTLHGTSCWNRARRSAVFGRWVNSPRTVDSIGNCQLGDSLYKDIYIWLRIHNACTINIVHAKSFIHTDPGIFPKMLPAIYVGESFIRDIYPDSHQKRSPLDSIEQSFPTTFHQTAKIQQNDRTCVTTWYTISVNVWPKVGVWNVKSWVQWWFRSSLCLERRRYPGDFADFCGWFGFPFMKKTSFFGAFSPINIDIL